MPNILFLNACVREESRTLAVARRLLSRMEGDVTELELQREGLEPLDGASLRLRMALAERGEFAHPAFECAHRLAAADVIVVAAPYWDLSFPAVLRVYLERANIVGVTFRYNAEGRPESLCAAKRLVCVTTAGGFIAEPNLGLAYLRQFASTFLGVTDFTYLKAEGLDIVGRDAAAIVADAMARVDRREWDG